VGGDIGAGSELAAIAFEVAEYVSSVLKAVHDIGEGGGMAKAERVATFVDTGEIDHALAEERIAPSFFTDFMAESVHVGQDDLSPEAARRIVGSERILGVSTHNPEQVKAGDESSADYVAIGPVFSTTSKDNPDPVIGLDGVKHARALTQKPLVAIGGITLETCRSVIEAGADSVAAISDLLADPRKRTAAFLQKMR